MLTPQEVADKKFRSVIVGGYDMTGVDAFLEVLTNDYSALFKENAILKSKIRVLVDKLEEYRKVDDSMRQALLGAQKMAEKIKEEAKEQSDKMMESVQSDVAERKQQLSADLRLEEMRLEKARAQTITFVNSLRELYQGQMEQLSIIPTMQAPPPSPRKEREQATRQAAEEIEQAVDATVNEQMPAAPEPPPATAGDMGTAPAAGDTGVAPAVPPEPKPAPPETEKPEAEKPAEGAGGEPVQSLEFVFGEDGTIGDAEARLIWEPEHDTHAPRPKFNFDDIENQFGTQNTIVAGKKRK